MKHHAQLKDVLLLPILTVFAYINLYSVTSYAEKPQKNLPDTYIVEEGDTLWGIAGKFSNNPYKWGKIWKDNDFITDPDKIFPGDPIDFKLIKEKTENTAPVEPAQTVITDTTTPIEPVKTVTDEPKTEKVASMETVIPPPVPVKKERVKKTMKVAAIAKELPIPPVQEKKDEKGSVIPKSLIDTAGFIMTDDDPKGTVISSLDDKIIMGKGDLLYIDIGRDAGATVGKRYTLYKTKDITHPITSEDAGYLVYILGTLEIKEVQKNISMAYILDSSYEIEAGNAIMDYYEASAPTSSVNKQDGKKGVKGYILASKEERSGLGEGDIVYIDSGSESGVSAGDEFVAYTFKGGKDISEMLSEEENLPKIALANLKVINVNKETSTALITKSLQEIKIGEMIETK